MKPDRSIFQSIKPTDVEFELVPWVTEPDLPLFFTEEELRNSRFKCVKNNLKIGSINKTLYHNMMHSIAKGE